MDTGTLLEHLPSGVVSIDLKYDDDFLGLKREVEKLSGTAFEAVQKTAQELLVHKSKDLRVLGYWMLAIVFLEGPAAIVASWGVYLEFVKRFWTSLYPEKQNMKIVAIEWLNQKRYMAFISQKKAQFSQEEIALLGEHIRQLHDFLEDELDELAPRMALLSNWLHERCRKILPTVTKESPPEPASTPSLKSEPEKIYVQPTKEDLKTFLLKEFESDKTLQKHLEALLRVKKPGVFKTQASLPMHERYEWYAQMHEDKPFQEVLKEIQALEAFTGKEVFYKQLAQLIVCLKHCKTDTAMLLLENLMRSIEAYRLEDWEPELAFRVYELFLQQAKKDHFFYQKALASIAKYDIVRCASFLSSMEKE